MMMVAREPTVDKRTDERLAELVRSAQAGSSEAFELLAQAMRDGEHHHLLLVAICRMRAGVAATMAGIDYNRGAAFVGERRSLLDRAR